jgi:hypothetical protein
VSSVLCRLFGHRRLRTKVWHDGVDYRAPCARCGAAMIRDMHGEWRVFDSGKDAPPGSQERTSHPHRDP